MNKLLQNKVKVTIKIESENGFFTQVYAGGLPSKLSWKEEPFILEFQTQEEGLTKVLSNVGAVFLRSQEKDNDSFLHSLKSKLIKYRNQVVSALLPSK